MAFRSGSVGVRIDWGKYNFEIPNNLEPKDLKSLAEYTNEMEKNQMAMINSVTEKKIKGVITTPDLVKLSEEFNGAITFQLPSIFKRVFPTNSDVVVTFANTKIIDVQMLDDYIHESTEEIVNKLNTDKENVGHKWLTNGFYISDEQNEILDAISNSEINVAVSLIGESGYGKTSIAEFYSRKNDKPILIIDCSTISDSQDWFVVPEFKDATTSFSLTQFSEYLISGNCVIVFDEINRMPSWVSNALLPILDHRQATHLRGVDVKCGNNITFFLTSNHGAEYTGTNPLDKALLGRISGTLVVDKMPKEAEIELLIDRHKVSKATSKRIVDVIDKLRTSLKEFPVNTSTRTSLYVAYWMKLGLSLESAVKIVIMNTAPDEAKKIIAETIRLVK